MNEEYTVSCPFCGETNQLVLDYSGGDQNYTEDCAVCCNPMEVSVHVGPDGTVEAVRVQRENP